jgi:hypothetical protein
MERGAARSAGGRQALDRSKPGALARSRASYRVSSTSAALGNQKGPAYTDSYIATSPGGNIHLTLHMRRDERSVYAGKSIREHLFEPFATGRPDGTGLGLGIVREVAEAPGGSIRVQHRDDGSKFALDIPIGPPITAALIAVARACRDEKRAF